MIYFVQDGLRAVLLSSPHSKYDGEEQTKRTPA
jgi:hypothetical protein